MKTQLTHIITQTCQQLYADGLLPVDIIASGVTVQLSKTRDRRFGDLSCNIAMLSAKVLKQKPHDIATCIIAHLPPVTGVEKVEVAGAGFINIYLTHDANTQVIHTILQAAKNYGRTNYGKAERVHLEYVSANPTGPLHVGHGRGAAYGATLANVLSAAGYQVYQEYYVNDAGRQMAILAVSIWARYLQHCGIAIRFPDNGYQGDYIYDIAKTLFGAVGKRFVCDQNDLTEHLPQQTAHTQDEYVDALIAYAKTHLGEGYDTVLKLGIDTLQADIQADLAELGVVFDNWFSERILVDDGSVAKGIEQLTAAGYTYEQDGALWFKASALGDDKDRVLVRDNGLTTYFASDVAYQTGKYQRQFDKIISIYGADHHGYLPRLRAVLKATGYDPDASFLVSFVQFAVLWRDQEKVPMSTRGGQYVTLRQLREEVGNDAVRFFYVMRKHEQHMDFDLALAKSQSNDNPVYYVQYAHARICSIARQLAEKNQQHDIENGLQHLAQLDTPHEKQLMTLLGDLPDVITHGAKTLEVHGITHYVRDVAAAFHAYYNATPFLVEDNNTRDARLCLIMAVKIVLQNASRLLGVSTPEKM